MLFYDACKFRPASLLKCFKESQCLRNSEARKLRRGMSKGIIWRIRNSRRKRAEVTSAEITRSHHHATKREMTYHYAFKVVLSGKRDELMKSDPECFIAALLCDTVIYRLPTEPALVFHETVVGMPWQRSRQRLAQFVHQSMKIFGSSYVFLLAGMLPIYEARRQKETSVLLGNYSFVFSLFFLS